MFKNLNPSYNPLQVFEAQDKQTCCISIDYEAAYHELQQIIKKHVETIDELKTIIRSMSKLI